ncbi:MULTISPECIES: helix-turn-helix domain-containing protein [unclassified Tenacibaculum]|uniref:helix-turn-helix domain-containing protein n=1 Tax=unclassified Tenacibaculum TaxID=2635139 RepID=UPI001F3CC689|nr:MULTISPECIES: helix-turn-helix domain-containing protein [unclassified Tenacibaculum]MCF2874510.1 helix-turn-helix domain-containing protein [Tenacibaculum sp. Cn5-1]MCF2934424.1 helix-turn-helix domain-containing protein [Tenacibaculum sp. Cn5-34]MCG7510634.1 helix-turn-helix domain-containing protein [Tenacibaculum sp. Cn5-46]
MIKELPNLSFQSKSPEIEGVEIITLESIEKQKNSLDHLPEKPHQLEFYQLAFYTEANTEHLVDFVWHEVRKNSIIYVSKGQVNAFKFQGNVKGFLILFTEEYFKNQLSNIPQDTAIRLLTPQLFSSQIQIPESSNIPKYIELLFNEFYKTSEVFNRKHIIDSLFNIIFSKVEEVKRNHTNYIKESDKLTLFLSFQTILKKDFTLSRNAVYYAEKLNITYKHLNVVCKEIISKTAKEYIDDFIILEAKRNLVNSTIKSTELAYQMGFEESTNFVKYFKKHTGLTPNVFKSNNL